MALAAAWQIHVSTASNTGSSSTAWDGSKAPTPQITLTYHGQCRDRRYQSLQPIHRPDRHGFHNATSIYTPPAVRHYMFHDSVLAVLAAADSVAVYPSAVCT